MPRTLAIAGLVALGLACRPSEKDLTQAPNGSVSIAPTATDADAGTPTTDTGKGEAWIREHYEKQEVRIPMRDGAKLFTSIYRPRDRSRDYPILYKRTPYSLKPYGDDQFPTSLGPNEALMERGYIYVYQDVRGAFMSEGQFVNMRPHRSTTPGTEIDESTDTYDTIDWLVNNVEGNNGRVGMYGISYPGFYAAAGMIDAHPALKAVSPQAPIADWYFDDFHHHGAFFLPHTFNFFAVFGYPRPELKKEWRERFDHGTQDGYDFFLRMGSLANANAQYLKGEVPFWNEIVAHPDYDEFWQARDLLPHLNNVAPAVMTVGGLFDAEDLYGPLHIYRSVEDKNPEAFNMLVMGPWMHGGWRRSDGDHLGNVSFGDKQSLFYRAEIETRFFSHYLESEPKDAVELPEAYVFETGANHWRSFDQWPPAGKPRSFWMGADHRLSDAAATERKAFDEFISDPATPVPFTEEVATGMTREYMTDDQRFASRRPDVLHWSSEPLTQALTVAGPVTAKLWVSTSEADADWVVKIIDVFPGDAEDHAHLDRGKHMSGYQMMVRSEIIRGRYRDSYEKPEPFASGRPTLVELPLQDVLHTFEPGHRVMIQVQSTWFPLVDRNPQKWVDNIFEAKDDDFVSATHRVYRDAKHPSRIELTTIELPPLP